jgi:hypothetical protein
LVRVYRAPCPATLQPPEGVKIYDARYITYEAGVDDAFLASDDRYDDDARRKAAHKHAFRSKVGGVPVAANLDLPVKGSDGKPLDYVLQMNDVDDWFIWFLFLSKDRKRAQLEIVRG